MSKIRKISIQGEFVMKVGLMRCMQTEDMCPGTTNERKEMCI